MSREPDRTELFVDTAATREATSALSATLEGDSPGAQSGQVIAILGERGSGRTHLATRLLQHSRTLRYAPALSKYIDAMASDFSDVYRRLMGDELVFSAVRAQADSWYADAVADMLAERGFDHDIVRQLRDGVLLPQAVVNRLGLMESALLRETGRRLNAATGLKDLSTALVLLLRTGSDDRTKAGQRRGFPGSVKEWLAGGEPSEVLRERGITTPITSEVTALDVLAATTRLYRGRRARFLLVFDDLLVGADQPQPETLLALRTLFESVADAGGCLVLTGDPDLPELLGPQLWQRISRTVQLRGFTDDEVRSFLTALQGVRTGRSELAPFTPESAGYLARLSEGNPRATLQLGNEAYRLAGTRQPITEDVVREAARHQMIALGAAEVLGEVQQVLDLNGWAYRRSHLLGADADSRADFWVTFDDRADGCALLLSEAILASEDVAAVIRRVFAIRQAAPGAAVILAVEGLLDVSYTSGLKEILGSEPIVHAVRGFSHRLTTLLNAARLRLPPVVRDSPWTDVGHRLDQINQQQSSIFGLLEQFFDHFTGAERRSDEQLTQVLRRELAGFAGTVAPPSGPDPRVRETAGVPAEVDRLFVEASGLLEELSRFGETMQAAFADTVGEASSLILRRIRSTTHFTSAIGYAVLLRELVAAFHTGIAEWYATYPADGPGSLSPAAQERLDTLCGNYAELVEHLPAFQLTPLIELYTKPGRWADRTGPRQKMENGVVLRKLTELSDRVRVAVNESANAETG
ncbi:hypothetical protein AB0F15_38905 [Amycolatopsis sp. NPDC026612]|uniref:hypothetical protein n=1 Tax=Amycolatopsis sp. NPDC026612 TaxID=3155466 RepID=UPI0034114D12